MKPSQKIDWQLKIIFSFTHFSWNVCIPSSVFVVIQFWLRLKYVSLSVASNDNYDLKTKIKET